MEMEITIDPIQIWLDSVGKRSHNKSTQYSYRKSLDNFLAFIGGKTAQQIVDDYKKCETLKEERDFKETYTDLISSFAGHLESQNLSFNSVNTAIAAVKSFFKYRHLPLNYETLDTRKTVQYPDRDISKEEVVAILKASEPRERAFFCMMAQSGLRPDSLCKLQLKDIQPDFYKKTVPCAITVQATKTKAAYSSYHTFMGAESIDHLQTYLSKERPNILENDYIFGQSGAELIEGSVRKGKPSNPKAFARSFNIILKKLKLGGVINYDSRANGKPAELKLYSLRKYFERNASKADEKLAQYWMGHLSFLGTALSYLSRNIDYQRKIYEEKAMPELRLETFTPGEHEKEIINKTEEIEVLKAKVADLSSKLEVATKFVSHVAPTSEEDVKALTLARMIRKLQKDSGKSMEEFLKDFTAAS
jgi:integrase